MGVTHLKAYQQVKSARLVAVCDAVRVPVNGILPGVQGNISGSGTLDLGQAVRVYRCFDELLRDADVELVDLCVPTPLHVSQAVAALKAGKHVICEKPLARTAGQARKIAAAAKATKRFLLPAMCLRFWPEWVWVKKALDTGRFGKALAARFRRVSEPPGWSQASYFKGNESGGALLDMHIHDTDFIQFLFGRPHRVFSTGCTRYSGAIDHVITQYTVAGGTVVHAEGTWLMTGGHGFNMAYTINFERATVDYDLSKGGEALRLYETGKRPKIISCKGPDGYVGELKHMIAAIQTGQPPTVVSPSDAVSAVEICDAEEKSIRLGRPVNL